MTKEAEARAEQAAAELLAELGLDDPPKNVPTGCDQVQAAAELLAELGLDDPPKNVPTGCDQVKKSRKKKKKGGKDNKK